MESYKSYPWVNNQNFPYKSRAERDIADLLSHYNIPFIYEKPTAVIDSGKTKLWHPDFSLFYGPLIEYFGINGSHEYEERTRHKLNVYQENQFDVIPLHPRDLTGNWQDDLLRKIDSHLEHRLADYRLRTYWTNNHR